MADASIERVMTSIKPFIEQWRRSYRRDLDVGQLAVLVASDKQRDRSYGKVIEAINDAFTRLLDMPLPYSIVTIPRELWGSDEHMVWSIYNRYYVDGLIRGGLTIDLLPNGKFYRYKWAANMGTSKPADPEVRGILAPIDIAMLYSEPFVGEIVAGINVLPTFVPPERVKTLIDKGKPE
jgi:hypothetical protein